MFGLLVVSFISASAIFSCLWLPVGSVDAVLVGLSLSYALPIVGNLNALLGSYAETEKELISVERVGEYIKQVRLHDPFLCIVMGPMSSGRTYMLLDAGGSLRLRRLMSLCHVPFNVRSRRSLNCLGMGEPWTSLWSGRGPETSPSRTSPYGTCPLVSRQSMVSKMPSDLDIRSCGHQVKEH